MVFQCVCRVVCGTYDIYIEFSHKSLTSVFLSLEFCCTLIINGACSPRVKGLIDVESSRKLEVGPVIKRVPHRVWDSLRPFLEFLVAAAVSCYVFLQNSVASERSPFVVVSTQPQLSDVAELIVVGDHLRLQVAVIVNDRQLLRKIVIQALRGFGAKHEVGGDKTLGCHIILPKAAFSGGIFFHMKYSTFSGRRQFFF